MKKLIALCLVTCSLFAQGAFACDEACMKEKAEAEHGVKFPGYLSAKYCEGIAMDFMTSSIRSLDNYRSNHFKTKYKGPLKNTKNYLAQRKLWLEECDDYLSKIDSGRIFNDEKTTKRIFASIDQVSKEFAALIDGATYATEQDARDAMNDKINRLFKVVDDHKTIMHLKGKYVVR